MLRSENTQMRSQLSTIQRRMFQEKQQVMDYLRQIENDLIKKERIKQQELSLSRDYEQLQIINKQDKMEIEQLKRSINEDRREIEELKEERSRLLKAVHMKNNEKNQIESELDNYKSHIQHLHSYFNVKIHSTDQMMPTFEDRHQDEYLQQVMNHRGIREIFLKLLYHFSRQLYSHQDRVMNVIDFDKNSKI